mmetsp:Transcript_10197/g.23865  ORF Transcript_10197/g.23865 Transcript_10197/m.23865 type:complete len:234 (-) Transcript_10197:892-1593(-)
MRGHVRKRPTGMLLLQLKHFEEPYLEQYDSQVWRSKHWMWLQSRPRAGVLIRTKPKGHLRETSTSSQAMSSSPGAITLSSNCWLSVSVFACTNFSTSSIGVTDPICTLTTNLSPIECTETLLWPTLQYLSITRALASVTFLSTTLVPLTMTRQLTQPQSTNSPSAPGTAALLKGILNARILIVISLSPFLSQPAPKLNSNLSSPRGLTHDLVSNVCVTLKNGSARMRSVRLRV